MNFNNFTIKSQEAVQQAVNVTQARGQQAIEPVHLLAGVLKVGENVTNFIFQKLGMNAQQIALVIDKQIDSLPKVSGGEPYLSRESNEILQRAVQYSKEMGDEFVSLEAIILALLNVKSTVATILKDAGMTDKELRSAIAELRKGEKVTSQSSEDTYQSLSKYAINLNEAARSGKLDPVIGRDEEIRRVLQILSRRTKNNPILIGEPGTLSGASKGFDRVKGDQMGMLATVINSLGLSSALGAAGVKARVLTAIRMEPIGEFYNKWKAIEAMENGEVVIMSAGTGNPFFTTDTGSSLRGIEIEADVMLKGTRVDGIYTADPEKDPTATKFDDITYDEVLKRGLKVMDLTATCMCKENNLPIIVFDMDTVGNLKKVMTGENIGTLVHN